MYTTYHLDSAQDITAEMIEAIKIAFKSKPIAISNSEELDTTDYLMSSDSNKAFLNKSLAQANNGEFVEIKSSDL